MKKIILYFPIVVGLITYCFPLSSFAAENDIITDSEYYTQSILSAVDKETLEALDEIGMNTFSTDEIFSVSFEKIGSYFSKTVFSGIKNNISNMMLILCIIVIIIALRSYFINDNSRYTAVFGVSAVVLVSVQSLEGIINMLINTLNAAGAFIHSFVPVYTLLLSLGGNTSSALTYNSVTFTFAQIITLFTDSAASNLLGAFLALSVAFSLNSVTNLNKFIAVVNKAVNTVVGFVSSTFAALLTVRGAFSASIDTVSSKSIRFIIGSLIPVVGSSISDAYSTLLGSINIIKGSVAVVGISVILIIIFPPVLEATAYCLFLSFASYISDMAELNEISSVLRALSSGLRFLIMLNFLLMFMLIISTAIMLSARGGV